MSADERVKQLIDTVLREIEADAELAARIRAVLGIKPKRPSPGSERRTRRRPPSAFDPFEVYNAGGETALERGVGKG